MELNTVRARRETTIIPTYSVGKPDSNPMFLEKRIYQGSSGAVYPFPVIDKIDDDKQDQPWEAVYLENQYLKIMLLPQLGGRVQMALDKTNNYHFVYYQHVIKPALVGLCGPWISGGIEFNWPQHHRPSTFMPVDYRIVENPDGSKTVWVHEIDRMHGTRSLAGFTLHPDRAVLEIKVRLYNGTPTPQTFLWWANPACHVDENHQSIFPPDVHAVMDHGKRDVSTFPIATGTYYKVNYAPGTDISRYKNIPVPTSYMAYQSDYDFVASYDHGKRGGLLHVANHNIAPGKKQWTWGHGDFGRAWDRQLTDTDGPYIELMCGVYTDNQPDFSWLHPYEEKSFTQYFMPYKLIGRIKNASIDGAINLEVENGQAYIGAYVTSPRKNLMLQLRDLSGKTVFEKKFDLTPESAFESHVPVANQELQLTLLAEDGREILSYTPAQNKSPIPLPAEPPLPPERIPTTEQLYLTALHLEQYRHATWEPEPYYREALRREPGDARCNNALGLQLYRRGKFEQAEHHFRTAIKTLTKRNPNPYDGEPQYNLGLALRAQGKLDQAYDAFYKSAWSAPMRTQGYFQLAQIASIRGDYPEAIKLATESLVGNWHNHKARFLKAALLRKLGKVAEADAEDAVTRSIDPMFGVIRDNEPQDCIELGLDYINAGLAEEGVAVLMRARDSKYPMLFYLAGWAKLSIEMFREAADYSAKLCFPNRLEELAALRQAVNVNPSDGHAWYLLGTILYAKRLHEEAIAAWEKSAALLPDCATTHRNLALAYFNKRHDPATAQKMLERAFALNSVDARILFELDQLYKKVNRAPAQRLQLLEENALLVDRRDDLYIEQCQLLNLLGRPGEVQDRLAMRKFHPWEGGEGKVIGAYVASLVEIAKRQLEKKQYKQAVATLEKARTYPENLGEGKLPGALENDLDYLSGLAYRLMDKPDEANKWFERGSVGLDEPTSAMFYNDQPPDMIFYQALCLRQLGKKEEAAKLFNKLIDYGRKHMDDHPTIDYFAVSLPEFLVFDDDLNKRNSIHCRYMMALGFMGLGKFSEAMERLQQVVAIDASHLGAKIHQRLMESPVWR